jgi:flagellin-like hook-associated protein FlgL
MSAGSYYAGDTLAQTHRADADRTFELDLNAVDPAFEKVIRALGMIAQGAYASSGGLASHPERVQSALDLLNSALDPAADAKLARAGEAAGTLVDVDVRVGFGQVVVAEAATRQRDLMAAIDMEIAGIENVDKTEAIARLLDEANSLEASFSALARIRNLSLAKFL